MSFTAILDQMHVWLAASGCLIGLLFGVLLHRTNFCTLGAVSDWHLFADKGRLGAVALATATAILGAQTLDAFGSVDLSKSLYLAPRITWLGSIVGGLIFGFGMVYAGGCPSRALIRVGSGDARALVTLLVIGTAAFAALSGILSQPRMWLQNAAALDIAALGIKTQSLTDIFQFIGLAPSVARPIATFAVAAPLAYLALGPANILTKPKNLAAGIGVGILATLAWAATGLAGDELLANPMQPSSLSFVRPVADAIDWLERSTALGLPGFAAATVFGTLIGSFVSSFISGTARPIGFSNTADFLRHLAGAAMMGIGGILALGCSIGQGVGGLSTLSVQSVLSVASIIVGVILGLKRLEATG